MLYTTGRRAREADACEEVIDTMAAHLGPGWGEDDPIGLDVVLDVLGLVDCLWALDTPGCVRPEDEAGRRRIARRFARECAERALALGWRVSSSTSTEQVAARGPRTVAAIARAAAARAAAREAGRDAAWAAERAWQAARLRELLAGANVPEIAPT